MLNRSASLAMSTSVLKALPGKLGIKRHSPSILYISEYPLLQACYEHVCRITFITNEPVNEISNNVAF